MKYIRLVFIFITLHMISSCSVKCDNPSIQLYCSGFDSTDLISVKIKQYEKYSNFQKLTVTKNATTSSVSAGSDTLRITDKYSPFRIERFAFDINYDYIIEIPALNGTFKVTGITYAHGSTPDTNHGCTNASSWYVDGKFYESGEYNAAVGPGAPYVVVVK